MGRERLAGAGKGRIIYRDGDTVRRPVGPQTAAVHALLQHLESVGFDGAPRVRGIDDEGCEVLSFVEGQEGRQIRHGARTLAQVGRLVREFHQAVEGFRPPPDAVWRRAGSADELGGPSIVCHGDLAPYNTIYRQGTPIAFIDWDLAGPAPAMNDVAHAAWSFVPLYPDDVCARIGLPVLPRGPRLRQFCDGYGLRDRDRFLDVVRTHLSAHTSPTAKRSVPFLDAMRQEWQVHLDG
jgi:hypothetical protein